MPRPPSLAKLVCQPRVVLPVTAAGIGQTNEAVNEKQQATEINVNKTRASREDLKDMRINQETLSLGERAVTVPALAQSDSWSENEDDTQALETFRDEGEPQSELQRLKLFVEELKQQCELQDR